MSEDRPGPTTLTDLMDITSDASIGDKIFRMFPFFQQKAIY